MHHFIRQELFTIPKASIHQALYYTRSFNYTSNPTMATVEINDAVFCQEHLAEIVSMPSLVQTDT